jgi:hypothetical protein
MPLDNDDDQPAYRVRLTEPDGSSRVIYGPDDDGEGAETQEYVAVDPVLEEFARHPFDPLISARATGRVLGLAVAGQEPSGGPWLRIVAGVLGVGIVVIGVFAALRWSPWALGVCPLGALIVWRALPAAPAS